MRLSRSTCMPSRCLLIEIRKIGRHRKSAPSATASESNVWMNPQCDYQRRPERYWPLRRLPLRRPPDDPSPGGASMAGGCMMASAWAKSGSSRSKAERARPAR